MSALFILEIFDNICSQFDTTEDGSLSAFAALARTCQAFRGVALDHLWSDLNDITPLVKCMPSDLWGEAELTEVEETSRPIVAGDWARFREYNRRVKSITIDEDTQCGVDVFRLLGEATGDQPLLPNVKKVVWSPFDYAYLLQLHVVMGPKVIDLTLPLEHIGMEFGEEERFDVIKNLASTYPLLEHVDLTYYQNTPEEVDLVSNVLLGWTQLRTLEANTLTPDALTHIASLPYLQRLSFADIDTDVPLVNFPQPRTSPSFPALQTLAIITRQLSLCGSLIETMQSCGLQHITIEVYGRHLPTLWKDLFLASQKHCNLNSLTSVCFRESCPSLLGEPKAEYYATIDTIQPLLSFPNLVSIRLPFSQIIITDSAAEAMAKAWPYLKDLSIIPWSPTRQRQPCLTLQGLTSFAYHCPELRSISLTLDALSIPNSNLSIQSTSNVRRGDKMRSIFLDADASPIESPQEVAKFLSAFRFDVQSTRTDDGSVTGNGLTVEWAEVAAFLEDSHSGYFTTELQGITPVIVPEASTLVVVVRGILEKQYTLRTACTLYQYVEFCLLPNWESSDPTSVFRRSVTVSYTLSPSLSPSAKAFATSRPFPSPTMNVLFISEILDNICSQIDTTEDGSLVTLAALARTCRACCGVALDYLWSDLADIAPLVKFVPWDLSGEAEPIEAEETLRVLVNNSWANFREYSRRVKSITIDDDTQCGVDMFRLLSEAAGSQPLLPNVKKVVWTIYRDPYLLYFHVVMGPKVVDLTLRLWHPKVRTEERSDVIRNLASRYPLLEHVNLTYYDFTPEDGDLVSNVLLGWTRLQTLKVEHLTPAALTYIASLPYLQHFSFSDITTDLPLVGFLQPRTSPLFPALQALQVQFTWELFLCSSLIEAMQPCALQHVKIAVRDPHPSTLWKDFFLVLQKHCDLTSLTSVYFETVENFVIFEEPPAEYVATINVIQPLLSFPNLSSISLRFSHTIITDSAAEAMAKAWPRLVSLSVSRQEQPCLTLQGLMSFARHCLELEILRVALDARSIPNTNPSIQSTANVRRADKKFVLFPHCDASPVESPQEVAKFLSALHFDVQSPPSDEMDSPFRNGLTIGWLEVIAFLENSHSG